MKKKIERQADAAVEASADLVEAIKPMLAGRDPEVVGAALGQLVAILVAGHHPELRDETMKLVIDMARDLVPVEIEIMIEAGRCGEDWRSVTRQ